MQCSKYMLVYLTIKYYQRYLCIVYYNLLLLLYIYNKQTGIFWKIVYFFSFISVFVSSNVINIYNTIILSMGRFCLLCVLQTLSDIQFC